MIAGASYERFVDEVMRRAAIDDRAAAEKACRATLRVLGARLAGFEADEIAEQLPEPLARAVRAEEFDERFDADDLYRRVAKRERGVDLPDAMEHAQAVCEVLGETLIGSARERLDLLPDDIAELFEPRATSSPQPSPSPGDRSIAGGRVGGVTSLAEGDADRAQRGSIAREENPHSDRKASSGHRDDTLATGKPR